MAESTYTDATLDLVESLDNRHRNVGAVIQARLRRSEADIERLAPARISVRLCKGIYQEPPEIAFQGFGDIRERYLLHLDSLLGAGWLVGIATHDPYLTEESLRLVERHCVAKAVSSSRCSWAWLSRCGRGWLQPATASGSTCPTVATGSATR
jgi:proline dehydrogenase